MASTNTTVATTASRSAMHPLCDGRCRGAVNRAGWGVNRRSTGAGAAAGPAVPYHRRIDPPPALPARSRTAARVAGGALVAGVVAAAAAWQGGQGRDGAGSHAGVAVSVAVVAVVAVVGGRGRQRWAAAGWRRGVGAGWRSHGGWWRAGAVVWLALAAAAVGWDLWSFAARAHAWPTLSRELGRVSGHHPGRAALFGAWLLAGLTAALAARRRRAP